MNMCIPFTGRGLSFLFPLAAAVLLAGCAASDALPETQIIPCTKPRQELMEAARRSLLEGGFSMRQFLPDSGYLRTTAKQIQTVNEISSRTQTHIIVEVRHRADGLHVNAFRLAPQPGSIAAREGNYSEDAAGVEEIPLAPGSRLHIFHIGPFLDAMERYCR